ncbi:VOC family protein [Rivibacter subsaxonicus]|uniref:Putative glyoxalase superfamily protein PhnB n=1 Tax=Rivibacter subsaxonicus TaxID=457575 RepID=A0A4Q7W0R6_9BURK|nr:VOC family protein [Rivibacter subsaxonicus]RZU02777.1 putative glyoxalase superfamily protein PhnB [Rivibacter subsaxonicus]
MTEAAPSPIHEVFAYLCVSDSAAAIEFYRRAFGATERFRLVEPSGRIGHAELQLGPVVLMLSDAFPEFDIHPPGGGALPPVRIHLHVDNADQMIASAIAAGATALGEVSDAFYGERGGRIKDPFGHVWLIGHSIEEVSPEEMQRRYTAMFEG